MSDHEDLSTERRPEARTLEVPAARSGLPFSIEVQGAPIQPFAVAMAPAGVLPGWMSTPVGLIDLDPAQGIEFILDGMGLSPPTFLSYFCWTVVVRLRQPIDAAVIGWSPVTGIGVAVHAGIVERH